MADAQDVESDISYESFELDSSDFDSAESDDNDDSGDWSNTHENVQFNDFDASLSEPRHNLDRNASVLDFFSLFWGIELLTLIVAETNR